MPLGREVGLLQEKGAQQYPTFRSTYCGQTARWIKMPLGTEVGLGSGHIVLDRNPAAPKGHSSPPPTFWPMAKISEEECIVSVALYAKIGSDR